MARTQRLKRCSREELAREASTRLGCVVLRYTRSGVLVGLYRSLEAGMESDPEYPLSTLCEEHSSILVHATRKEAESALAYPEDWCELCTIPADTSAAAGALLQRHNGLAQVPQRTHQEKSDPGRMSLALFENGSDVCPTPTTGGANNGEG